MKHILRQIFVCLFSVNEYKTKGGGSVENKILVGSCTIKSYNKRHPNEKRENVLLQLNCLQE